VDWIWFVKFLADNGGEFANDEYKDMCENLNIEVRNTAARSPWQNRLCERNHAVVDKCLQKVIKDNPKMKLEIALVWYGQYMQKTVFK